MYRDAEGAGFCFECFGLLRELGERDAKEFRDRQNTGHASEAAVGWNVQGKWLPSGGLEGSHSPIKEREEASASSHWLDTVPGLS